MQNNVHQLIRPLSIPSKGKVVCAYYGFRVRGSNPKKEVLPSFAHVHTAALADVLETRHPKEHNIEARRARA